MQAKLKMKLKTKIVQLNGLFFQFFHTERTQNLVNYSAIRFSSSNLSSRSKKKLKKL
jgi:hypothetical protein